MKITLSTAIIVLAAITAPVFSETSTTSEPPITSDTSEPSHTYIGFKGGPMNIGSTAFNDDGVLIGILFGYDVPDNGFAFEGEFNTTVSKASSDISGYGDLGVTTLAGYGVYRTSGRFYLKAKLGLLYEYLTSSVSGIVDIDVDQPGLAISIGVGGGWRVTDQLSAEVEFTSIEADIGYASLGLNWAL